MKILLVILSIAAMPFSSYAKLDCTKEIERVVQTEEPDFKIKKINDLNMSLRPGESKEFKETNISLDKESSDLVDVYEVSTAANNVGFNTAYLMKSNNCELAGTVEVEFADQ